MNDFNLAAWLAEAFLEIADDPRPCKGANSNVCVGEGCYGEACVKGGAA